MTQQQHLAAQESNERNGKNETLITAIEVTNPQARLDFLFSKLRSLCHIFERSVFNYMRQHAIAYQGGFWDFYHLSNGGFYLQPPKGYMLTTPNGFMDEVTAQEAGIIVTLMMLSHFSFLTDEKGLQEDCERISDYFHQLREYIFTLSAKSQSTIFRAID